MCAVRRRRHCDRLALHSNGRTHAQPWFALPVKEAVTSRPCFLEVQNDATKDRPVGEIWPDRRLLLELAETIILEMHALIEQVLNLETCDADPLRKPIADTKIHDEEVVMPLV